MICTHCIKRKAGPPIICPCTKKSHPHVICAECASPSNDSITAANADWLNPLSRTRIGHTDKLLADNVFRVEPWGCA